VRARGGTPVSNTQDAILVDEFGGEQRLPQFAAAPICNARPSDALS